MSKFIKTTQAKLPGNNNLSTSRNILTNPDVATIDGNESIVSKAQLRLENLERKLKKLNKVPEGDRTEKQKQEAKRLSKFIINTKAKLPDDNLPNDKLPDDKSSNLASFKLEDLSEEKLSRDYIEKTRKKLQKFLESKDDVDKVDIQNFLDNNDDIKNFLEEIKRNNDGIKNFENIKIDEERNNLQKMIDFVQNFSNKGNNDGINNDVIQNDKINNRINIKKPEGINFVGSDADFVSNKRVTIPNAVDNFGDRYEKEIGKETTPPYYQDTFTLLD